ncbi:MAG: insulinase family protein [Elusimicrobiota bacterium]|jgi:predicted Zn-dependent peptidase|nr:insulinase family protein [Elusimicrobiota bacterium]
MKKIFIVLFFIFLSANLSFAQVKELTLSNKIKVLFEKTSASQAVSIKVFTPVSSSSEQIGKAGLSHLVYYSMKISTLKRLREQLLSDIDDIGADISGDARNQYAYIGIDFLSPTIDKALDIISDIIINPAFNPKEIETAKDDIKISLRERQDNIMTVAMDNFIKNFYQNTPYAFPNIGTIESINSISVEDIKEWHRYSYSADNILISVAGNIDEKILKKALENYFSKVPSGGAFKNPSFSLQKPSNPSIKIPSKFHQSAITVGFESPSLSDEDFAAFDIAVNILGDGMNGRLGKEIRVNLGLTYGIYMFHSLLKENNFTLIASAMDDKNVNLALKTIDDILKDFSSNEASQDELDRVKAKAKSSYLFSNETVQAKSFNNGWGMVAAGDYNYNAKYLKKIEKVSKSAVLKAAQKVFSKQSLTIVIDEKK